MNIKASVFFVCVLFVSEARARLGETPEQLTNRFGQPTGRSDENITSQGRVYKIGDNYGFEQEDWRIRSVIIDGRCAKISYTKSGEWTEDQIRTVLAGSAQGDTWMLVSKPAYMKFQRRWTRSDKAVAEWNANAFTITHPAYDRAEEIAKAKAKADASRKPNI